MRALAFVFGVMLVGAASCNGCHHAGGGGDGGMSGGGDLGTGGDLAVQAGACNVDSDCGDPAQRCCDQVCVETADCATSVTAADKPSGYQNGGDYVTLHGHGFATGMKVFIGDGRAPVLVQDAQTARIQTPPGPVGMQDVRIVVGSATAILHKGYAYRSAGLEMTWQQKPLQVVRGEDPGIAVMQDGRVLVAGGTTVPDHPENALATAEIYTRSSDTVAPAANAMSTPRWQNSAVTLLDGRVLVVGGAAEIGGTVNGTPTLADLFDPQTNTFTPTANPLNTQRFYTHAVLMVDGRVFISSANDQTIEIYDPVTDKFKLLPHTTGHIFGQVVRLRDGRVLLFGGDGGNATAELFDPDTDTFSATGSMMQGRSMFTAHTLPDGRVLAIAGASNSAGAIKDPLPSIEIYDPKNGTWTTASYALKTPRCWQASALVRDGTVLVMGGYTVSGDCGSSVASVEVIDPVAGTVSPFGSDLPNTNTEWTAATLLDGSILGVGGGACNTSMALPDIDFLAGAIQ